MKKTFWLKVIILLGLLARFLDLYHDAPYGIISSSGTFWTDEGFYTKSAQLFLKFGFFRNPEDVNFLTLTSLFVPWMVVWFKLFGISLYSARCMSILCSFVSLFVFYKLMRKRFDEFVSLLMAVIVVFTLQQVGYARMAIVEPFALMLSLIILYFVFTSHSKWMPLLTIPLLLALFFVKSTHLPTIAAIETVFLHDVFTRDQSKRGMRLSLWILSLVILISGMIGGMHFLKDFVGPTEWSTQVSANFDQRLMHKSLLFTEARLIARIFLDPAFTILAIFFTWFLFIGILRSPKRFLSRLWQDRIALGFFAWLFAGLLIYGTSTSQPSRYYYFMIYPMIFLIVWILHQFKFSQQKMFRLLTLIVLLHLGFQIPGYAEWLSRSPEIRCVDMAQKIAAKLDSSKPVVVGGALASFVSFFGKNIHPCCDCTYHHCETFLQNRPEYAVLPESGMVILKNSCRDHFQFEILERYHVMQGWNIDSDTLFTKIHYHHSSGDLKKPKTS